jgi:putative oxidoreductase
MTMRAISNVGQKDVAMLPGRLALGSTMLFHGASKLKREATVQNAQFFESVGIRPGRPWVMATAAAEIFAGLSAILGVGTRLAALAVLATQGVAIARVHRPHGFSNQTGGFEFNLALMALATGLLIAGPGTLSAHELAEHRVRRSGKLLKRLRPSSRRPRELLIHWLK